MLRVSPSLGNPIDDRDGFMPNSLKGQRGFSGAHSEPTIIQLTFTTWLRPFSCESHEGSTML